MAKIKSIKASDIYERSQKAGGSGAEVAGGAIIGGIGITLMAVTQVAAFDITGGIITGLGLLVVSVVVFIKRGSILNEVRKIIDVNKSKFKDTLSSELRIIIEKYFDKVKSIIEIESENEKMKMNSIQIIINKIDKLSDKTREIKKHISEAR